jgi:hypothetical protein
MQELPPPRHDATGLRQTAFEPASLNNIILRTRLTSARQGFIAHHQVVAATGDGCKK